MASGGGVVNPGTFLNNTKTAFVITAVKLSIVLQDRDRF
jgi:hypothetical protein